MRLIDPTPRFEPYQCPDQESAAPQPLDEPSQSTKSSARQQPKPASEPSTKATEPAEQAVASESQPASPSNVDAANVSSNSSGGGDSQSETKPRRKKKNRGRRNKNRGAESSSTADIPAVDASSEKDGGENTAASDETKRQ